MKRETKDYSNTSHVNVYLVFASEPSPVSTIQIHLMLMFIYVKEAWYRKTILIQIHLMLMFIFYELTGYIWRGLIQIHLMLMFIPDRKWVYRN